MNSKTRMNNVLIISGEGRNVGKTTLGCRIIENLPGIKVMAFKISPHFHRLTESLIVLKESSSLIIAKETDPSSGKDSSRYLQAGASEVLYVQCRDENTGSFADWMIGHVPAGIPVICETGGLKQFITPGYSIFIRRGFGEGEQSKKNEVIFNNNSPDDVYSGIKWTEKGWMQQ